MSILVNRQIDRKKLILKTMQSFILFLRCLLFTNIVFVKKKVRLKINKRTLEHFSKQTDRKEHFSFENKYKALFCFSAAYYLGILFCEKESSIENKQIN